MSSDVHESLSCIEFSLTTMDINRLDGLSSELSDRADSADSTTVIRPILVHWVCSPSDFSHCLRRFWNGHLKGVDD